MRIYLKVPFKEKDEAKALGARFDGDKKAWYVNEGTPLKPFSRWVTEGGAPPEPSPKGKDSGASRPRTGPKSDEPAFTRSFEPSIFQEPWPDEVEVPAEPEGRFDEPMPFDDPYAGMEPSGAGGFDPDLW